MSKSSTIVGYDLSNLTVATLGSHSALDICLGAKQRGFKTLVVGERGREKTYGEVYRSRGNEGCVDDVLVLSKFKDLLLEEHQQKLIEANALFVPHRSFEAYLNFDYDTIEKDFTVPMFGNRFLLRIEERNRHPNQYDLLREASIRMPHIFLNPKDIDKLVLVKVLERERGFERAFFIVSSYEEFQKKSEELIQKGVITTSALQGAIIEEFILGVQVNLNYFYSPVFNRLEFLGGDTRRQTNLEGFIRLPAFLQREVEGKIEIRFEEAGHMGVTILESMLESVFELGNRFVSASKKLYAPGIIGPFALQAFILPGPPKKEFVVFDVSPRVPGSPGLKFTPYGEYLWRKPMSVGERIAIEIEEAVKKDLISSVVT